MNSFSNYSAVSEERNQTVKSVTGSAIVVCLTERRSSFTTGTDWRDFYYVLNTLLAKIAIIFSTTKAVFRVEKIKNAHRFSVAPQHQSRLNRDGAGFRLKRSKEATGFSQWRLTW